MGYRRQCDERIRQARRDIHASQRTCKYKPTNSGLRDKEHASCYTRTWLLYHYTAAA